MSGGYRLQRKTYSLKFEEYPGLEVTARSVSVGELLQVLQLADQVTGSPDGGAVTRLFGWFSNRVVDWNLEDEDGEPVPPTVDGLLGVEFDMALRLVMAWVQAVSAVRLPTVTAPTAGPPANGNGTGPASQVEESIPMTPGSGS